MQKFWGAFAMGADGTLHPKNNIALRRKRNPMSVKTNQTNYGVGDLGREQQSFKIPLVLLELFAGGVSLSTHFHTNFSKDGEQLSCMRGMREICCGVRADYYFFVSIRFFYWFYLRGLSRHLGQGILCKTTIVGDSKSCQAIYCQIIDGRCPECV